MSLSKTSSVSAKVQTLARTSSEVDAQSQHVSLNSFGLFFRDVIWASRDLDRARKPCSHFMFLSVPILHF